MRECIVGREYGNFRISGCGASPLASAMGSNHRAYSMIITDISAAYDKAAILDNQTVDTRLHSGSATAQMQAAERRGYDAAIAKVRAWALRERKGFIEVATSHNDMWVGSANGLDALLEFLSEVRS
jgi:hypothetical protein